MTDEPVGVGAARAYLTSPKKLFIDGAWRDAASEKTIESRDPATEKIIAQFSAGGAVDIDEAVAAARQAFESGPWRSTSPQARGELLWRLADLLEQHTDEFAALETFDNGSPLMSTRFMVNMSINMIRFYAGMATKIYGKTSNLSNAFGEFHSYTRQEPVGVVGLIAPWNGPITVVCNKLAPAIAAGCTCIVKPAELTSLTALRLGELIEEAGFPPGVVNIVTGFGAEAGAALANHPDVDKISFTGSTTVGRSLIQAAAGNFKRLTLELGGKSPLIIMDDADLEEAIPGAAMAIFANSGQVCFAGSRLFVHAKVYDALVEGVVQIGSALKLGNGFEPDTQLGPLISNKQRERVLNFIDIGRSNGAAVLTGGEAATGAGYYVKPTVFANADMNAQIVREEIFGPVVVATRFEDLNDVLRLANDTNYGLGSGVFTRDISKAHKIAQRLRAGNVWINCYGILDPSMPFGGFKESGWGREFGTEGLDAFLETKAVHAKL